MEIINIIYIDFTPYDLNTHLSELKEKIIKFLNGPYKHCTQAFVRIFDSYECFLVHKTDVQDLFRYIHAKTWKEQVSLMADAIIEYLYHETSTEEEF